MPQLFVVALLTSGLGVLFRLAYQAHLPVVAGRDHLVEANAKVAASSAVAETSAFSAGGWLVQLLTAPGAVLVDALSFVMSAAFIARIRTPEQAGDRDQPREPFLREAAAGLRFTFGQRLLRTLAGAAAISNLTGRMVGVTYLIYLNRELGFSAGSLGLIFAVGGVTSFASSLVAGRVATVLGLGPAMAVSAVAIGVGTAGMPLATDTSAVAMALLVANHLVTDPAATFYEIGEATLRQSLVPAGWLGRVTASIQTLEFGAALAGIALAGFLAGWLGVRETLWVAVGGQLALGLALCASPLARMHRIEPTGPGLMPEADAP